jgi:hypothetical protein
MTITNKLRLPEGLARAVAPNGVTERHNEAGCISATTLIQGVKHIILTERHWDELTDDVSDRIWAIWGQAVHSLLEHEGENEFAELEMSHGAGGVTVTGRIDNYDMRNGVICDYKTASVWKVKRGDFDDWYKQGMIYAWLLRNNGFAADKCRFIALLKDHSKSEAAREGRYPQNPVYVYEFDVTFAGLLKINAFILGKVREYARCAGLPDDGIPPCAPEERWDKAPVYAVMKPGRKSAVRLFDDRAAAETMAAELGGGHYAEHRPGESVKCQSFCLCRRFCDYYQNSVQAAEAKTAA